jgi:hypothetical protein
VQQLEARIAEALSLSDSPAYAADAAKAQASSGPLAALESSSGRVRDAAFALKPLPPRPPPLFCWGAECDQGAWAAEADVARRDDDDLVLQSPAKRSRLTPGPPSARGAPAGSLDGAVACSSGGGGVSGGGWELRGGGRGTSESPENRPPSAEGPPAAPTTSSTQQLRAPLAATAALGPTPQQLPLHHGHHQQHAALRKRRFASGLANLFLGCSHHEGATLSPEPRIPLGGSAAAAEHVAAGSYHAHARQQHVQHGQNGQQPHELLTFPFSPQSRQQQEQQQQQQQQQQQHQKPSKQWQVAACADARAKRLPSQLRTPPASPAPAAAAALAQQCPDIAAAVARALGLPAHLLLAAAASGAASTPCLPVAGLPLLSGPSLASVVAGFKQPRGQTQQAQRDGAPGLTHVASSLGGTPVRLWCQALLPGTPYTALGPVCSGLLQRHPLATALLAACFVEAAEASGPSFATPLAAAVRKSTVSSSDGGDSSDGGSTAAASFILVLEEGFGAATLHARLAAAAPPFGWRAAASVAREAATALAGLSAPAGFCPGWSLSARPLQATAAATAAAARRARTPSPRTPHCGSPAAAAAEGTAQWPLGPTATGAASAVAASVRLASGAVRFCPALSATDVWLQEGGSSVQEGRGQDRCLGAHAGHPSSGGAGAGSNGGVAAKVSLVAPLMVQLLPAAEGEACATRLQVCAGGWGV